MVTGYPEQTEEKMVGFLDPRQWTRVEDEPCTVLWTPWSRSRWKLINEVNRFPGGKQNLFLEILQKRKISYAGQVYEPGDTCYYLTMNPEFSAIYPLDEALLDRISVCVPAFQPNFLAGLALSERERGVGELAVLCLVRDFTLCERAPSYDKTQLSSARPSRGLCAGCHYSGNPEAICWQADEGLSDRVRQDLRSFSRALAYLLDREADLETSIWRAMEELSIFDDPIARLDFIGDHVGERMNGGRIYLRQRAGDYLGLLMKGGRITVFGRAGRRAGWRMKGGTIRGLCSLGRCIWRTSSIISSFNTSSAPDHWRMLVSSLWPRSRGWVVLQDLLTWYQG